MFKESLFTRTLTIELSGNWIPKWGSTIYKERGNVLSFQAPIMYPDKKICGTILFTDHHLVQRQPRMLNKMKDTIHLFDIFANKWYSTCIIFYPLNDKTLVVEAGDAVELHFQELGDRDKDVCKFWVEVDL